MRSKYEIKAQKSLEKQGWTVDYKARPFRVPSNYQVDYFGLFDLIAYRAGDPLRWISIKGKAGVPSSHREEIEAFALPMGNQKEIWQYRKLKGYRKVMPKKQII
jgi:hypothetical protein